MQDNRISVIIPAYQAGNTIDRALRSVASQTLKPGEIVVVDDGSDDDTASVAEALRPIFENVKLTIIRQANAGAGAARNRAIAECTGIILAFLDADDEWLPEKLKRSIFELDLGCYSLVAHNSWIVDGSIKTQNDCALRFRASGDPYENLYRRGYIDTSTVIVKRDLVIQSGGFNESLLNAQDFELWLAVLQNPSEKFLVFEDFLSRYFISSGSIMSFTERRRECAFDIAIRYAPVLQRRGSRWFSALLFRVLVIHFESINAHLAAKRYGTACKVPIRGIFVLIRSFVWAISNYKCSRK